MQVQSTFFCGRTEMNHGKVETFSPHSLFRHFSEFFRNIILIITVVIIVISNCTIFIRYHNSVIIVINIPATTICRRRWDDSRLNLIPINDSRRTMSIPSSVKSISIQLSPKKIRNLLWTKEGVQILLRL